MTEPTYRLDVWQQELADELARRAAQRPPVTVLFDHLEAAP